MTDNVFKVEFDISREEIKQRALDKIASYIVENIVGRDLFGFFSAKVLNEFLNEEDKEKFRHKLIEKLEKAIEETNFKEEIIELAKKELDRSLKTWLIEIVREALKEND